MGKGEGLRDGMGWEGMYAFLHQLLEIMSMGSLPPMPLSEQSAFIVKISL